MKLTSKAGKFRIVGKNNDGIIVRLFGSEDVIHVYGDDLKLNTAKTVQFKNQDGLIQHIQLNKNGAVMYYLQQEKKYSVLHAQPVNGKMIEMGKAVAIDTIYDRKELIQQNLRFKISADQNFTFIYYPFFAGGNVQMVRFMCIDNALQTHTIKDIPMNRSEADLEESRAMVDNRGNCYIVIRQLTKEEGEKFDVYRISESGEFSLFTCATDKDFFNEYFIDIDNKNGQLALCSFYDDDGRKGEDAANGFLYALYNPENGQKVLERLVPFNRTFMSELTGRDMGEKGRLYTFNIKRLVLRNDGGIAVLAESFIKDTREVATMGMQPGFNTFRTASIYQYNDIIAFSISPDGVAEWTKIMRKKQVSEDDNGAYSSFMIMNQKDRLRLLYLDDISLNGILSEFTLYSDGSTERKNIINQEPNDVLLLPKTGRQIAPDAVVLPSFKNGALRLVKITFP